MMLSGLEHDVVADADAIKQIVDGCRPENQRALLDNIAHDIVEHCQRAVELYTVAMANKSRPTPKKCYTDFRKELIWLGKAQKVFQVARMKWQEGLKEG